MPVDLRNHDPDDTVDIDPGTNKARIIKLLYSHPNLGFKPAEVHDRVDIPKGSVTTTLARLHEDGAVGKTADGYYHALENRDDLRRFATSLVQVEDLIERYGDDGLSPEDVDETEAQSSDEDATEAADVEAELADLEDDLD